MKRDLIRSICSLAGGAILGALSPGLLQAHVFWVVAGVIVVGVIPLILRVPEHKGAW